MKVINVGLLGCGTVGTGVAKLLIENQALLRSRVGAELRLKNIADIDTRRDRGLDLAPGVMVPDALPVVDDPEIDIIVEMIGGEGIARELILKAIKNGKQVVTANKALLAIHGNTLFAAAAAAGVDLAFEASVGGCMPIIKTLRESLVANRIHAMTGILNGTCNYILTKISEDGSPFQEALAEAQKNGFAEADPTLDVEGFDTAHKLALLTALAFGIEINYEDITIEGISKITPQDIGFAADFGYRVKLLAIGKDRGSAVEARVHPTMIPEDNILSSVGGSLNAITVSADAVGDILLSGRGAGMLPTASAVLSDVVDIARNLVNGATGRVPALSYQRDQIRKVPLLPIEELTTHYYFRFSALDRPGVLSKISGILGNHEISLKSVHQKGRKTDGAVPIVMLTHRAREADVKKALAEIAFLDVVSDRPVVIRIEDDNDPD
ncbi:MAG: homoserine dehydrogenase [Desulfobacterales bacterium]|jgi:homoserine dehydrogenase|nr:homoserine dehydrogenase [Desulfobacterales bacterium]